MSLNSWHLIEVVTLIAAIAIAVLLVLVIKAFIAGCMKRSKAADIEIGQIRRDEKIRDKS
ncbi:hypothetical protein [Neomicrococcus lactis]|uniref:hypothetical protein n=1 Tax=Neomicrococcus lactis TaxID=732241 RepID=UPI0023013652|nr:hypothetical protein [Neomicrococcus lactis]